MIYCIKDPENFLTFEKTKTVFSEVACESLGVSDELPLKEAGHYAVFPAKATVHFLFVVFNH